MTLETRVRLISVAEILQAALMRARQNTVTNMPSISITVPNVELGAEGHVITNPIDGLFEVRFPYCTLLCTESMVEVL